MGVYSHYSAQVSGSDVVANESYVGTAGAYRMMEEGSINEHAIFEAIIGRDFCEAYNAANPDAVTESDLEYVNEASVRGIWGKVVEFFKKVWEKILGILKTIKDKIQAVFIKDGKELVKKYEKQINKKMNDGKLTKMKYKWRKKKAGYDKSGGEILITIQNSKVGKALQENLKEAKENNNLSKEFETEDYENNENDKKELASINDKDSELGKLFAQYTNDERTDFMEDLLGDICGQSSVTSKEFKKEYLEHVLDDEETEDDGLDDSRLSEIKTALTGAKKELDMINKNEKACNNYFKPLKKEAEDIQKRLNTLMSTDKYSSISAAANKMASRTLACMSIISTASSNAFTAVFESTKVYLKQCRAVYIKAATYNQKESAYESAVMLEAVEDVSNYEVEEMFSTMY